MQSFCWVIKQAYQLHYSIIVYLPIYSTRNFRYADATIRIDLMTITIKKPLSIAILSTGDEVCQGDIVNTNSQEIALRLTRAGINVRQHLSTPDTIAEIEQGIRYATSSHDALIITGGLGPTSDDLTRYALANVLTQELIFDEASWNTLCARLQKFGYPTPPESNRQQALFPKGSRIIPNHNGTAAGCLAMLGSKPIYMLPGPPSECLPLIDEVVLPNLLEAGFARQRYFQNWYLFGVSEGKIAEELDAIVKPYTCITGYRLFYPYLEFKIHSHHAEEFAKVLPLIKATIQPHLINDGQQIASTFLQNKLSTSTKLLTVCDHATGGALEAAIKTPETHQNLHFTSESTQLPRVEIYGLSDFWQGKTDVYLTDLEIQFFDIDHHEEILCEIPFRGKRVVHYAVELICRHLIDLLALSKVD